jgi:pemK-like protein
MSQSKSINQLTAHKKRALSKLEKYLDRQISSENSDTRSRADKLSYWIEDYTNFLKREETFDSTKSINYRRGDIVKAHLGFRLGNEEGGLHFGVVMDVSNSKKSDTLTIIPLTSQKANKPIHPNSVALGSEIFRAVTSKHAKLTSEISSRIYKCDEAIRQLEENENDENSSVRIGQIKEEHDLLKIKLSELNEVRKSIVKMKDGSIALVNQIVTISKMRIYDPVYSRDVLYGIRLSPTTLSMIDEKIIELYLGKLK